MSGDTIALHDGTILTGVHMPDECLGPNCCIHNPSDHPLRETPLAWLGEIRAMFRVCEHGYFHPDPDDLAFLMQAWRTRDVEAISSVHLMRENCDGCCHESASSRAGDAIRQPETENE